MDKLGRKLDQTFLHHLQKAIDHSPACVIIAEAPSGEIVYINEAVRAFRGKTSSPLTGIEVEQYMHSWKEFSSEGKLLQGHEMPLGRAITKGEVVDNEEVIVELDDGSRKWAIASACPVFDDNHQLIAGIVIWYDITRQKQLEQRLLDQAQHDALTGLYSRHTVLSLGQKLFRRAITGQEELLILMFDIDDFKQINDNYGHPAGDVVLKSFADTLSQNLRANDVFGRIGGEEFLLFLPACPEANMLKIAEKFRLLIEQMQVECEGSHLNITTSIGACALSGQCDEALEFDTVISHIDKALYQAKHQGKNQVFISRPPGAK